MNNEKPRDYLLDLSFLPDGQYSVEYWADGKKADNIPTELQHKTIKTGGAKPIKVHLAAGGVRNAQKANPEQNYYISLVVFEGDGVKGVRTVRDRVPVEKIDNIRPEEYCPGSCTPLYDAMGLSINALDKNTKKNDLVLVTIITDGMENSSSEYSGTTIKSLEEEDIPYARKDCRGIKYYLNCKPDPARIQDEEYQKELLAILKSTGSIGVNCDFKYANKTLSDFLHRHGYLLSVWTVNKKTDAASMIAIGVDNITSRRPETVEEAMADHLLTKTH